MKATFTLTNAVPQFEASNSGPWQEFERKIRNYAKTTCGSQTRKGTLYLLTGRSENGLKNVTKPSITNTFKVATKTLRLDTPRAVWTAGCCVWMTGEPKAESFAVMSNNHYNKTKLHQTQMNVTALEGSNEGKFVSRKSRLCSKLPSPTMINRPEIIKKENRL